MFIDVYRYKTNSLNESFNRLSKCPGNFYRAVDFIAESFTALRKLGVKRLEILAPKKLIKVDNYREPNYLSIIWNIRYGGDILFVKKGHNSKNDAVAIYLDFIRNPRSLRTWNDYPHGPVDHNLEFKFKGTIQNLIGRFG